MPVIGKYIPLARIFSVQGFSCFRAELSIQIAFLNAESRCEAHQRRAEKTTRERGNEDNLLVSTDDANGFHLFC